MNFFNHFFNNSTEIMSKKCKLAETPIEQENSGSRKNSITESFKEMQLNQTQVSSQYQSVKSFTCIQIPQPINKMSTTVSLSDVKIEEKLKQKQQKNLNLLQFSQLNTSEFQPLSFSNFIENKSCIPEFTSLQQQLKEEFVPVPEEISKSSMLSEELKKQNLQLLLKQFMQTKEPQQQQITPTNSPEQNQALFLKNLVMLPYGFSLPTQTKVELPQQEKKIGKLTESQRKAKVEKYLKKKESRQWKAIRYDVRKNLADQRERCQGRFVKQNKPKFHLMQLTNEN